MRAQEFVLHEACWKGYHKEGNKKMFGKTYPNCVKNKAKNESSLTEFAPDAEDDDGNNGFNEETLRMLAAKWYNGDEDPRVEATLAAIGWEIGQDEGYDDEPGVFVVRARDVDGKSYISWPAHELTQGVAEGSTNKDTIKKIQIRSRFDDSVLYSHTSMNNTVARTVLAAIDNTVALASANLRGADLRGIDLRLGEFQGADLRNADLRGTDLRGTDLRDADLSDADLRGAKTENKQGMAEGARVARKAGQPADSKKHSDLYTDENPRGTITGLKFATAADARASVSKIRNSGRSHAHKIQAAVAMEQRARAAGKAESAAVYRRYINANKKSATTAGSKK